MIFDLDDDGDLEIVTNEFGSVPQVLQSNLNEQLGNDLHFLKVGLVGTRSNRDGLGARVSISAGDRRWTQIQDGKSGYLSQSRMPLYFGLGDVDAIDRIDLTWPSGLTTSVEGPLAINAQVTMTEPAF